MLLKIRLTHPTPNGSDLCSRAFNIRTNRKATLQRLDRARIVAQQNTAFRQSLPRRIVKAAVPKAGPISHLGLMMVFKSMPTNSKLMVGFGVAGRLIDQDHGRRKCGSMLTTVVQVHDLQQLLMVQRCGVSN